MTNPLAIAAQLPAMSTEAIERVQALQDVIAQAEQAPIPTEHLLHAGMYARTIRIGPGVVFAGALLKVATTLVIFGDCTVFIGKEVRELSGYNVLAGAAGRKQAFVTHSEVCITAIFPTDANTVPAAEAEATDEHAGLLSRRQGLEVKTITGVPKCPTY